MAFLSCSDDDEDGDNEEVTIISKWQLYEEISDYEFEPCSLENWIEFKADGNYSEYFACEYDTHQGTWILKGNMITLELVGRPFPLVYKIHTLTNKELVLEYITGGEGVISKYNRK